MTSKLVSAFEYYLTTIDPLLEDYAEEGYKILMEESFDTFLEFLEEKGSIPKSAQEFFTFDAYLYEIDEEGNYLNYYEENFDKRNEIVERAFGGEVDKYAQTYNEETLDN